MSVLLADNPQPAMDQAPELSLLAWAGWQLEMPSDWQPLKLMGTADKGWMMLGDQSCAMFSVHWERTRRHDIQDGRQWVEQRLGKLGLKPDSAPPAASHFTACGWAVGVQEEEGKLTTYWYGYSEPAQLLLGVKVNGVLPAEFLDAILLIVLPSLRTSGIGQPSVWAMHHVIFVAPAGFVLTQKHLFSGDVALEFKGPANQMLLLRQVYPGELALQRRSFERWLEVYPFKEHRRLHQPSLEVEPWSAGSGRELAGIRRSGRKQLGIPLGMVNPRWTEALAVMDSSLNRLLIAELMTRDRSDATICRTAILQMNSSLKGGN